jgi:putative ABC transport system substrate-binding protein
MPAQRLGAALVVPATGAMLGCELGMHHDWSTGGAHRNFGAAMRRRTLVAGLLASAVSPNRAPAQQGSLPVIGFLHSGAAEPNAKRVAGFRKGLKDAGFVEGQNVAIEFRWAQGQEAKLAEMAADLIARRVAVIATLSSTAAAVAAKAATGSLPIFFLIADPPVELGLVASLSRPGGNATGITTLAAEVAAKRLTLLRELTPNAARLAALIQPRHPSAKAVTESLEAAAGRLAVPLDILHARTDAEIEAAYVALKPGSALLIGTDPSFFVRRAKLVELSARHSVPTIYDTREFAGAGGLISYGANIAALWEQAAASVARILKGEKPGDLPVVQATTFEMVLNLKTAKALGLTPPHSLLGLADDVVE